MWRPLLSAAVVFAATVALSAQPAETPKLLVVSTRTGNAEIFLMAPDGTGAKNLTDHKAEDYFPAWSPDGKRIAFTSTRDGRQQLYIMDADGSNQRRLVESKDDDRAPSWSPDGKRLVFARTVDGNPEVFVVNADGTGAKNLTDHKAFDADPAWSPDGKTIAFASNRAGDGEGFHVYLMNPDGSDVRKASDVPNPYGYVYPAWSPDGKTLAHTDIGDNALEIVLRDPAGKKLKALTKLGGANSQAAWAADGKRLAFLHVDLTDLAAPIASLYLVNADGSDAKAVLAREVPVEGGRPAWQPRGR